MGSRPPLCGDGDQAANQTKTAIRIMLPRFFLKQIELHRNVSGWDSFSADGSHNRHVPSEAKSHEFPAGSLEPDEEQCTCIVHITMEAGRRPRCSGCTSWIMHRKKRIISWDSFSAKGSSRVGSKEDL